MQARGAGRQRRRGHLPELFQPGLRLRRPAGPRREFPHQRGPLPRQHDHRRGAGRWHQRPGRAVRVPRPPALLSPVPGSTPPREPARDPTPAPCSTPPPPAMTQISDDLGQYWRRCKRDGAGHLAADPEPEPAAGWLSPNLPYGIPTTAQARRCSRYSNPAHRHRHLQRQHYWGGPPGTAAPRATGC